MTRTETPQRDSFLNLETVALVAVVALAGAWLAGEFGALQAPVRIGVSVIAVTAVLALRLWAHRHQPFATTARTWAMREPRRFVEAQQRHMHGVRALSPRDFEDAIRALYEALGYSAKRTPFSGDGGWDVEATRASERLLIECKHYGEGKTIGRPVLQKLHSAVITQGATAGVLITTSDFSRPARQFASEVGLSLIDASGLAALLAQAYPAVDSPFTTMGMCSKCGEFAFFDVRIDDFERPCPNGHSVANPLAAAVKAVQFGPQLVLQTVGGRVGRGLDKNLRSTILCIAGARSAANQFGRTESGETNS